jgi:3',5'-cyclic-nucleotide phosphodiesterase
MRVRILGSYGNELGSCRTTSFLLDDRVLLDAGSAAGSLSLEEIEALEAVVLTHSHIDHVGSIPFLLDNRLGTPKPLVVHATRETIEVLRTHLFNNKLWPNFERIPDARHPMLQFVEVEVEQPFAAGGLTFTACLVNHTVPTVGYLVEDSGGSVAFSGDTGPTERLWECVAKAPRLRGIFVEVSFPARLDILAGISKHLSTQGFRRELAKLPKGVPVYIFHMKPMCEDEIRTELAALSGELPHVRFAEQGQTYRF